MYITITGELGSGKSTIGKILKKKYGFEIYSTGTVQREIAKEMGMTTLELNEYMAKNLDNDYDKMIDNKTIEISKTSKDKNIIFDSRMAWHFVDESFKVFVSVDKEVAAKRVMGDNRGVEEQYKNCDEAVDALVQRKKIEDARFKDMYKVDTTNPKNFDLVIDSSKDTAEELAEIIYTKAKAFYTK